MPASLAAGEPGRKIAHRCAPARSRPHPSRRSSLRADRPPPSSPCARQHCWSARSGCSAAGSPRCRRYRAVRWSRPDARFSIGIRSGDGSSSQSTSPAIIAFAAVAGSGMIRHSTRSSSHLVPAGVVRCRLLARHVLVEPRECGVAAGDELVRQETERPAADDLGQLLERIGGGETFRHDHRLRLHLRQEMRQQRERLFQPPDQRAIVRRLDRVDARVDRRR